MLNLRIKLKNQEVVNLSKDYSWWQKNRNLAQIEQMELLWDDSLLCGVHNYQYFFLGLKQISISFMEPHELIGIGAEKDDGNMEVCWFFVKDGSFYEKEIRTKDSAGFFLHKNI
jgi:hypothetical protein